MIVALARVTYVDALGQETDEIHNKVIRRGASEGELLRFFRLLATEDASSQLNDYRSCEGEFILDFPERIERYRIYTDGGDELGREVIERLAKSLGLADVG